MMKRVRLTCVLAFLMGDDKAWKWNYYCEFNFTIVNLSELILYVNAQSDDHFKVEKC